jgi:CTP synthase (UTP-ammonia lyase)
VSAQVKIGIVGDFDPNSRAHRATNAALAHAGRQLHANLEVVWLPTESVSSPDAEPLSHCHGLWCAPGSPYRSKEGALRAIRYAREQQRPFFAT